jgi:hypothetical protein
MISGSHWCKLRDSIPGRSAVDFYFLFYDAQNDCGKRIVLPMGTTVRVGSSPFTSIKERGVRMLGSCTPFCACLHRLGAEVRGCLRFTYWLTNQPNNLTHSLHGAESSWEASSRLSTQEVPKMLRKPKAQYRVHKSQQLLSILSQMNPVHAVI